MTVVIPYLLLALTGASPSARPPAFRLFGLVLIFFGALIYAWSVWTFTFVGKGTPDLRIHNHRAGRRSYLVAEFSAGHLHGPRDIVFAPLGRLLRRADFEKEIR